MLQYKVVPQLSVPSGQSLRRGRRGRQVLSEERQYSVEAQAAFRSHEAPTVVARGAQVPVPAQYPVCWCILSQE